MLHELVIDASVVVKFFVREASSEIASRLLNSEEDLVAPDHFLGEVGEVLVRRCRAGLIRAEQLPPAAAFLAGTITSLPIAPIFDDAVRIAIEASISFYDALYVSAALREDTKVVTADGKLVRRLQGTQWKGHTILLEAWKFGRP
jgi:predicted nucleic acid-binding protein